MTPLKDRLATLPWVLAGPILRKVTAKSVTVWVALQETATLTLSVTDDTNQEVAVGARSTVAVGANLHIAAVTAHPTGADLKPGIVYHYDIGFWNLHRAATLNSGTNSANELRNGHASRLLFAPGGHQRRSPVSRLLPYAPRQRCRALALLDVLIEQAATNATARPHQLLLTGDQIYADDVAAALLPLLTDAGDTLLYGGSAASEDMPGVSQTYAIPPYWRYHWLDAAGFTSDDMRSHLMSLAEYLAMYLFTWSDVLWPVSGGSADLPVTETIDGCQRLDSAACLHGTFIAGMLAATRTSSAPRVCPDCTLLVRSLFMERTEPGHMPSSTPQQLAEAIIECIDAGACKKTLGSSEITRHPCHPGGWL